jgi:hypothetical protein
MSGKPVCVCILLLQMYADWLVGVGQVNQACGERRGHNKGGLGTELKLRGVTHADHVFPTITNMSTIGCTAAQH